MTYYIYLSSGSYSDFSVHDHYMGPVPWEPVLDALVRAETDKAKTWQDFLKLSGDNFPEADALPKISPWFNNRWAAHNKLTRLVADKAEAALLAAGYVKIEAEEVWLP